MSGIGMSSPSVPDCSVCAMILLLWAWEGHQGPGWLSDLPVQYSSHILMLLWVWQRPNILGEGLELLQLRSF
jgi:hypothetical protein